MLLGVSPEVAEKLRFEATPPIEVIHASNANEALKFALAESCPILLDLGVTDRMVREVAIARAAQTVPPLLFTVGGGDDAEQRSRMLNAVAHLGPRPSLHYLTGALDAARRGFDGRRLRTSPHVVRIQALYDLSSKLLRTANRTQLQQTLHATLPQLFKVPFILVCLPASPSPNAYCHAEVGLTSTTRDHLRAHLQRAWSTMSEERAVVPWEWIDRVAPAQSTGIATEGPDAFLSAPIARGARTRGLITLLPDRDWGADEARLQSFFVVGDLLSVVLHNFDLIEELERRATHDGLTGVLNRQTLVERFEAECARARRHNHDVSMLVLDLDHFKNVNDTHGHYAGDEALRAFAAAIQKSVREYDLVGRSGGEEFMVLAPQTSVHGAALLAERIRRAVSKLHIRIGEETTISITVSIGVASANGEAIRLRDLSSRADSALYRAKQNGRNRVSVDQASLEMAREPSVDESLDLELNDI